MKKGDFVKVPSSFIGIITETDITTAAVRFYNGIKMENGVWVKDCLTPIPQDELLKSLYKMENRKRIAVLDDNWDPFDH